MVSYFSAFVFYIIISLSFVECTQNQSSGVDVPGGVQKDKSGNKGKSTVNGRTISPQHPLSNGIISKPTVSNAKPLVNSRGTISPKSLVNSSGTISPKPLVNSRGTISPKSLVNSGTISSMPPLLGGRVSSTLNISNEDEVISYKSAVIEGRNHSENKGNESSKPSENNERKSFEYPELMGANESQAEIDRVVKNLFPNSHNSHLSEADELEPTNIQSNSSKSINYANNIETKSPEHLKTSEHPKYIDTNSSELAKKPEIDTSLFPDMGSKLSFSNKMESKSSQPLDNQGMHSPNKSLQNFEIGSHEPGSEPEDEICFSKGWDVEKVGVVNITTLNFDRPEKTYNEDMNCVMTFKGSRKCTSIFSCYKPLSLRGRTRELCETDYIKLEDGLGGSVLFCGQDTVPLLKASQGGQDLFLTFHSGSLAPNPKLHEGISCYVKCMDTYDIPKTMEIKNSDGNKKQFDATCKCGTRTLVSKVDGTIKKKGVKQGRHNRKKGRIVGGTEMVINEYPFLVPIVNKDTRAIRCGGSIINSQFVLSAAHCFIEDDVETTAHYDILVHARLMAMTFTIGEFPTKQFLEKIPGYFLDDKSDKDENTTRYRIVEKIFHPLFTSERLDGDIVLLKLDRKISFIDSGAVPVCLPEHRTINDSYDLDNDPYVNVSSNIAGWGKPFEKSGAYSRLPLKLNDMPVIPYSKCKKLLPEEDELTERMLCAGFLEGGRDSCQGDSGSPLFIHKANKMYLQIGINSWGDASGCAKKDSPGVYTDLRPLMQWIYFHTSQTEGVDWCTE